MIRKIITVFITLALGLALASCRNANASNDSQDNTNFETKTPIISLDKYSDNKSTEQTTSAANTNNTTTAANTNNITTAVTQTTTATPVVIHIHNWQIHYVTTHVSDAWDEPVYAEVPLYSWDRIQNITGMNLDAAYRQWLADGGDSRVEFMDWALQRNYEQGGWTGKTLQIGTHVVQINTIHHPAVDNTYADYFYCTGCSETKTK